MTNDNSREEFKVSGDRLVDKIKELIRAGNARKIIIKNEKRETVVEFPLMVGAIGTALAPILAAAGAIAALLSKCTLIVEKKDTEGK